MKNDRNNKGQKGEGFIESLIRDLPIIGDLISRIGGADNHRSGADCRREQNQVSDERKMAERLKILLSIPINSPEYPEELDELLEVLWQENASAGRKAVWKNSSMRFRGALERLKENALRESEARIQNSLRELRELIGQR